VNADAKLLVEFVTAVLRALDIVEKAAGSALIGYQQVHRLRQRGAQLLQVAERLANEADDLK
jgi:hypothetical protein